MQFSVRRSISRRLSPKYSKNYYPKLYDAQLITANSIFKNLSYLVNSIKNSQRNTKAKIKNLWYE